MRYWVSLCRIQSPATLQSKGDLFQGVSPGMASQANELVLCIWVQRQSSGEFFLNIFSCAIFSLPFRICFSIFLVPSSFRIQHLPFKEHLFILFLRQPFLLSGVCFYFWEKANAPLSFTLTQAQSFLSGSLLPLPREEFSKQIDTV